MNLAAIPSPAESVWHLGPVPIRAYALCIVLGIVAACWITEVRLRRRGAPEYLVLDIAVWAVPFGIVGARLYHVLTDVQKYFGEGRDPADALQVWQGGLGIPGAILGGALGAWIACRRRGVPLSTVADALAPGLPVAQAIGRFGNWFNQELYGKPTTLPWALEIDPEHREPGYDDFTTFHPAFAYEALWNLGVAGLILWAERRFRLGRGRAFALYVMAYAVGRFWIEALRIDDAHTFGGLRLNQWTMLLVFAGALAYFLRVQGPPQHLVVDEDGTIRAVDEGAVVEPAAEGTEEPEAEAGEPAETDAESSETESSETESSETGSSETEPSETESSETGSSETEPAEEQTRP